MKLQKYSIMSLLGFGIGALTGLLFSLTACKNSNSDSIAGKQTDVDTNFTFGTKNTVSTDDQKREFEKILGQPVDPVEVKNLVINFRKIYCSNSTTDKQIPYAVCFTISELRALFHLIDSDLNNIPVDKRGVAFMIGLYPQNETSYRKNRATIIAVATKFEKSGTQEGRVTTLDNEVIHLLKPSIPVTIANTRAYDVGHIYP
ncbi:hypothetical protein FC093_06135 [Ilyomonas limi]|uniref:Uncharacterized protein n=1 Tax=Ilyomonas limi TaxID=2575867 RepID=A0A4U3L547_9BACT|nr:hypothetical protein [Ilyomonas limi]TKK70321.1 hypothetical protein FC093_06135 [Ilyomonas limi]